MHCSCTACRQSAGRKSLMMLWTARTALSLTRQRTACTRRRQYFCGCWVLKFISWQRFVMDKGIIRCMHEIQEIMGRDRGRELLRYIRSARSALREMDPELEIRGLYPS